MALEIRPETPEDFPAVLAVHRRAFGQDDEAHLVATLRGSAAHIPELSLVAVEAGQFVGHILFSPIVIRTLTGNQAALALAPLAVAPEAQGRGIGSALVRAGLEVCIQLAHPRVIVLGHAAYYPRFGFKPASAWGIRPPFAVPEDAFMACELSPGALAGCAGVVEYPPAFGAV
jgi:putative acetyltransferase